LPHPDVLARLVSQLPSAHRLCEPTVPGSVALTERERSKEIARRLGISERTIKVHLSSLYTTLGVDLRAAIAVAAQ
jgi:two-component system, NarL family, response regulator YdfI